MDEQQLQEMEAWIREAACFSACDEQEEAALWSLIAEVRRLQQQQCATQVTWADAVTQAQQERDAARETVTAVMVRLVPVVSDAAMVGKTYGHYDVVGIVEQAVADLAAAKADVAQPPALPPLPEGWVREGVRDIILYRSHDRYTGVDGHVPPGGQVSVHAEGLRVSTTHVPVADLLIVLRHAERAHQELKGGSK